MLRARAKHAADTDAAIGGRATALADIAEWLDHVTGHPETDSPTGNLVEAVLVGLGEMLCPELVGDLRAHWMAEP